MRILSFAFFAFTIVAAVAFLVRAGILIVRVINGLFDKIEDKIG